jgi:hypothetical protein
MDYTATPDYTAITVAALYVMRERGAVKVGAKTCLDDGGKWRRAYDLTPEHDDLAMTCLARSLFPSDGSTEVWFLGADGEYMNEDGAWPEVDE